MRARRSVGVGGEHSAWCLKCAWSPAMEMAAKLATMAMRDNAVVGRVLGGLLVCRGIIHNPVCMHLLLHIIVQPQCTIVHPIFVKRTLHPALQSVTTLTRECSAKPGMMWTRCTVEIQCASVRGLHLIAVGQACDNGFVGKLYVGDGGGSASVEEVAALPQERERQRNNVSEKVKRGKTKV